MKLLFAASSGGHYEQLLMLRPLMEKYDSIIVTEKTDYKSSFTEFTAEGSFCTINPKTYYMHQINRKEPFFVFKYIGNTFRALRVYFKEKPDVIITTGVLGVVPMAYVMKLFKKKLVFIESFAKVKTKTQSGKALYKHSDLFFVQWPQMLKEYPDAVYKGGIY